MLKPFTKLRGTAQSSLMIIAALSLKNIFTLKDIYNEIYAVFYL